MSFKSKIICAIQGHGIRIFHLRGDESSRDIDFLILTYNKVLVSEFCGWLTSKGFKILYVAKHSYLLQLALEHSGCACKVDFFTGLCWNGVRNQRLEDLILKSSHSNNFTDQITILQKAIYAGSLRKDQCTDIFDLDIPICAKKIVFKLIKNKKITVLKKNTLRFILNLYKNFNLNGLIGTLCGFYDKKTEINLLISITGPDGSGKTTLISKILSIYKKIDVAASYTHFFPVWWPRLNIAASLAKDLNLNNDVVTPFSEVRDSNLIRIHIRYIYYILSFIIINIIYKTFGSVRFVDRFGLDIATNYERFNINKPIKFYSGLAMRLFSENSIIVSAPANLIVRRKAELTAAQVDMLNDRLESLSKMYNIPIVYNQDSVDNAVEQILNVVSTRFINKLRILKWKI